MKIAGRNAILYIAFNASPQVLQPVGCSRTCVLTTNAVTAGVSTIGSGIWSEFKALSMNWTVSVDGLATFNENINIGTLRKYQTLLQSVYVTFNETAGGLVVEYQGYAIITGVTSTGNYNDVETYSVQLQGTGSLFNSGSLYILSVTDEGGGISLLVLDFDGKIATNYTVRTRDITAGTTSDVTNNIVPRGINIDNTHDYAFSLSYDGGATFSPEIYWSATEPLDMIINMGGNYITNSTGDQIINN